MTPCNDSHENNSSEPSGRTLRHAFGKNSRNKTKQSKIKSRPVLFLDRRATLIPACRRVKSSVEKVDASEDRSIASNTCAGSTTAWLRCDDQGKKPKHGDCLVPGLRHACTLQWSSLACTMLEQWIERRLENEPGCRTTSIPCMCVAEEGHHVFCSVHVP